MRIQLDRGLDVQVCDDGVGLPDGWRAGVGIASMRERVAELGGDLVIGPALPREPGSPPGYPPGAAVTEPVRVLIADDHPLFRDGLTALLTDGPDTDLAATATTGTEAVDLPHQTQPCRRPSPLSGSPSLSPTINLDGRYRTSNRPPPPDSGRYKSAQQPAGFASSPRPR